MNAGPQIAGPPIAGPKIAGLILAGGGARRLGGVDKPLLTVGALTILERIIAAMELADIAISANGDSAWFEPHGRPVLPDGPFADQGPLAGILARLDWVFSIGAAALLTVPGDTPFVPHGLAAALSPPPPAPRHGTGCIIWWLLGRSRHGFFCGTTFPGPAPSRRPILRRDKHAAG